MSTKGLKRRAHRQAQQQDAERISRATGLIQGR
jgi:hypothetical protein